MYCGHCIKYGVRDRDDDLARLTATFDLIWTANQKAIKMWQDSTGKTMEWPGQKDLVIWLLERVEALQREVQTWKIAGGFNK